MTKNLTCIICPQGCSINVEMENGEVKNITGNTCKRGYDYAYSEVTNPVRTITSTVKSKDGDMVPVKTSKPIPKELIFKCMEEINKAIVNQSIKIGDVVIENILDTGADVVATRNVDIKQ